jgi:hypothetical protein
MENVDIAPKNVNENSLEEKVETQEEKSKMVLIFLVVFFLLCVAAYVLFLTQSKKTQNRIETQQIPITLSPTKALAIHKANAFETEKTKISSSLDAPSLYPSVTWQEVPIDAKDHINTAMLTDDSKEVSFKNGHLWKSQSPAKFFSVEEYYSKLLVRRNWTDLGRNENLEFSSFNVSGIIADGVCGGVQGSLGYKDGFIRLIAIRREIRPCSRPDFSNVSSSPTQASPSMYYEVFISDPTPLEEIAPH